MAKKKTTKVEEQPKVEEITETKPSNNSINIGYTGTVTISICDNKNNIISTKKHHNEGSANLFKYFCYCIAGDYKGAASIQPRKVVLISRKNATVSIATVKNLFNSGSSEGVTEAITISSSGAIDTYGTIIPEEVTTAGTSTSTMLRPWKAILHFRIPYAYITSNTIAGLILFPENTAKVDLTNITKDWQAYYLLTKEGNSGEEWAELSINSGQNYNLIIDWELSISNNTESNS